MKLEKTLMIEGMKCMHCVAHTKEALKKIKGVKKVDVSLEEKKAVVETTDKVSDDMLKEAVENLGFKLVEIK